MFLDIYVCNYMLSFYDICECILIGLYKTSIPFYMFYKDCKYSVCYYAFGNLGISQYIKLSHNTLLHTELPLNMSTNHRPDAELTYNTQYLLQIARFMGPTWGPSGANRTQVGPMLAPWTSLSGTILGVYEVLVFCGILGTCQCGLMQDCSNSNALTMDLLQSGIEPLIWSY